jgi:hypothetical protein
VLKVLQDNGNTGDTATTTQISEAQIYAQEQYLLAAAFLPGLDRNRYGKFLEDLENDYNPGPRQLPKDGHRRIQPANQLEVEPSHRHGASTTRSIERWSIIRERRRRR